MAIHYGVAPETFKLVGGNDWVFSLEHLEKFPQEITLHTARRDAACFQILLSADEFFAVNVGHEAWFSQKGQPLNLRLTADACFDTAFNIIDMHLDDDGYYRADALLTQPVIEQAAGSVRSIWVEMAIPQDTKPGQYTCKIGIYAQRMFEDETHVSDITAQIEVHDYLLPTPRESGFHLDLWQHSANIARKHEVALWSDAHFEILDGYLATLGALGQKAATLIVSEIPWSGQSCFMEHRMDGNMFEYSMIPVYRDASGFRYDFSIMQRYIDLCARHGIGDELSLYGLANIWQKEAYGYGKVADGYPDGTRIRYFDEAAGIYRYMRQGEEIDAYVRALHEYFIATGQIERVRLAADEPADIQAYRACLERLQRVAPRFKFKAAINHAEFIPAFGEEVYDFVPGLESLCSEYDKIMEYKASMEGKRFLWYVCCAPDYPNTFLSSNLLESQFIGVLTSYAGLDGFLRWAYTIWNDHPRQDMRYGTWKAADTHFVYPSPSGGPLLSLRYKALKRGIELFNMLEALKKQGDGAKLKQAYAYVVREGDIRNYFKTPVKLEDMCSLDYADYEKMRVFLMEALGDSAGNY